MQMIIQSFLRLLLISYQGSDIFKFVVIFDLHLVLEMDSKPVQRILIIVDFEIFPILFFLILYSLHDSHDVFEH